MASADPTMCARAAAAVSHLLSLAKEQSAIAFSRDQHEHGRLELERAAALRAAAQFIRHMTAGGQQHVAGERFATLAEQRKYPGAIRIVIFAIDLEAWA
jgi:hypothetical protein